MMRVFVTLRNKFWPTTSCCKRYGAAWGCSWTNSARKSSPTPSLRLVGTDIYETFILSLRILYAHPATL